jgi:hypothetical protein
VHTLLRQLVIRREFAEYFAGVDGHRAVEKDRYVAEASGRLDSFEIIQQRLNAPDGKSRNDNGAATFCRRADDLFDRALRIGPRVQAITIGRFDDQVICFRQRFGLDHDRVIVPSQVTGEGNRCALPLQLERSGPEDVPGMAK